MPRTSGSGQILLILLVVADLTQTGVQWPRVVVGSRWSGLVGTRYGHLPAAATPLALSFGIAKVDTTCTRGRFNTISTD